MVVFRTKVEIAQQNGRFCTSDHQNYKHQEQKAEHVIQLRRPDRIQDEEQLDEDAAEGQNSSHYYPGNRLCVNRLFGNQSRYLICSHWVLQSLENLIK